MASTASAAEGTTSHSGTNSDASHRRHLAGVLTARAVSTSGGVVYSNSA
jgi:hypothetical protein